MWRRPSYDEHGDVATHRPRPPRQAPPDETPFLGSQSVWVRGLALLLATFWVAAVFLVGGFLSIASPAGGWLYATLCFLPGLVAAASLGGVQRWRDILLVATAASFLLGLGMYDNAPPDHGRIHAVAAQIGVPVDGWELEDSREYGDTWCLGGCPEVVYSYAAPGSPDQAVATLDAVLDEHGWVGGAEDPSSGRPPNDLDPEAVGRWSKGRWRVSLQVPSEESRHGHDADVAAGGLCPVEVTLAAAR